MKDDYVYPGHQKGPGMEVRDLFAAHALQGIIASEGISGSALLHVSAAWTLADMMMEVRPMTHKVREEAIDQFIEAVDAADAEEDAEEEDMEDIMRLVEEFSQIISAEKEKGNDHAAE
jgi:predicted flavoprotein YhiN